MNVQGLEPYLDLLRGNPLLAALDDNALRTLWSLAAIHRFDKDQVIFSKGEPGDCFYAILSGRVGIETVSLAGKEILLNILEPGEVFGEIAVLDGLERTAGAVALEQSQLFCIGRKPFLAFARDHDDFCFHLISVLCARLRWTSGIIEDTIFLDIPRRLAKRLLSLIKRHGVEEQRGVRIDIRLSQEDLGNMLGATRESVNKGLRSLQASGTIVHADGYIIVRDIEDLRALCAED